MRILVTGAGGFAGPYLIKDLLSHGYDCVATDRNSRTPLPGATVYESVDIRDTQAMDALIQRVNPQACIHMAGITSVPDGLTSPDRMLAVNVHGTLNLIEALRRFAPAARLLTISTAHVYGVGKRDTRFTEDSPLRPISLYAISKAAADLATLAAADAHGIPAMVARPNNHTGPGQPPRFVVGAFAAQVADIKAGRCQSRIEVGNLDSERDFMDVRDVVRAYRLLIEAGQPGCAYNIGSSNTLPIGTMLDTLCRLATVSPEVITDPARVRPTDYSPQLDTHRLSETTNWQPSIPFEQTLIDMLNHNREQASS